MRHLTRSLIVVSSALLACSLAGCIAVGGTRHSTAVAPTTGQQLIDLKRALDCGALSPAEFEAQKSRVMNACSK